MVAGLLVVLVLAATGLRVYTLVAPQRDGPQEVAVRYADALGSGEYEQACQLTLPIRRAEGIPRCAEDARLRNTSRLGNGDAAVVQEEQRPGGAMDVLVEYGTTMSQPGQYGVGQYARVRVVRDGDEWLVDYLEPADPSTARRGAARTTVG